MSIDPFTVSAITVALVMIVTVAALMRMTKPEKKPGNDQTHARTRRTTVD
jgi:hypothetical protein